MKNIKSIFYIHGFNSHGNTGIAMEELFKQKFGENFITYHPQIPANQHEARKFVDDFIKTHKIDLIIGSSLGGFIALNTKFAPRIVINPCLDPYTELPKLGCDKEIYESYEDVEIINNKLLSQTTFGVFGNKDEVLNYKDEFSLRYDYNKMFFVPEGKHKLTTEQIEKFVIPVIYKADKIINDITCYEQR